MNKTVLNIPKHILVIRLSAMGDVAMLVPVLQVLKNNYPYVKITILSRKFLKPIFDKSLTGIDVNFHEVDTKGKHKGISGISKLTKEIRKLNIDAIADVHNVLRSKMLRTFLFGIKKASIDKGRKEKKALINHTDFKQLKSTHERYADVFRNLGFKLDLNTHILPKKPNVPDLSFLNSIAENGKKWIGIAPFAQYEGKMYPLILMKQVIAELAKTKQIFLFGGGQKETAILSKIESKTPNTINVAGKINLLEELQLIAHLDTMIAMDSGNAHFAAMFGVKTISIWGITHPFAGFTPFKQQDNCILPDLEKYPKIPCSIYGNKVCRGYEKVMHSITVKTIVSKV